MVAIQCTIPLLWRLCNRELMTPDLISARNYQIVHATQVNNFGLENMYTGSSIKRFFPVGRVSYIKLHFWVLLKT